MIRHLTLCFVITAAVAALAARDGATSADEAEDLVVHEWGTFTSIAGQDGRAVQWLPQAGPIDLPCFVERIIPRLKGYLSGTVRMETPVIYFYSQRERTVNVAVRFRQGIITEWFPRPAAGAKSGETAAAALDGRIAWTNVTVKPGANAQFPVESLSNHYYEARQTDAAPIQSGSEMEKFLFYRGVGRLTPPIAATVSADGRVIVTNTRGDELGDVMLFENRSGAIAYQTRRAAASQSTFDPLLVPDDESPSPGSDLQKMLIEHGLFPKEAKAMVDSWRDSWFERGTRLFYIVSSRTVDAMLPLQIDPRPTRLARVFVGRLEIVTPETLREVRDALERNDRAVLVTYGRFLHPIAERLLAGLRDAERSRLQRRLQSIQVSSPAPANRCAPINVTAGRR